MSIPNTEAYFQGSDFLRDTYASLSSYNQSGASFRVNSDQEEMSQVRHQYLVDILTILESNQGVETFSAEVEDYLESVESSTEITEDKYFAYIICLLAQEAAVFWEANKDDIVAEITASGRVLPEGIDWNMFTGVVLGGAVSGGLHGLAGGAAVVTFGVITFPGWATGAIVGGIALGAGYLATQLFLELTKTDFITD